MFDFAEVQLGGVSLIIFTLGIVQFIKTLFGWDGNKVIILSASVGALMMLLYNLIAVLPPVYSQILNIVVTSIAAGLSASGYYQYTSPIIKAATARLSGNLPFGKEGNEGVG